MLGHMSYWVLEYRYTDQEARAAARPDHLAYMGRLHEAGTVVLGGPIGDGGAMVLLRADSEQDVRAVIADDPYTHAGAAGGHVVRPWNVVIGGD